MNDGKRKAGYQRHLTVFPFHVTPSKVQRNPGQGRSHFETAKTFGFRGCLANLQDAAAHSAASPRGMDKEGSYLRRIVRGVEKSVLASCAVIAAKECLPLAPTSAAGDDIGVIDLGFGYKVGPILNQLCVYAEDAFQGQLQLSGV